jgi:hypothetical protein
MRVYREIQTIRSTFAHNETDTPYQRQKTNSCELLRMWTNGAAPCQSSGQSFPANPWSDRPSGTQKAKNVKKLPVVNTTMQQRDAVSLELGCRFRIRVSTRIRAGRCGWLSQRIRIKARLPGRLRPKASKPWQNGLPSPCRSDGHTRNLGSAVRSVNVAMSRYPA